MIRLGDLRMSVRLRRKGDTSGDCRLKTCDRAIETGEIHLWLLRHYGDKWYTKRFHVECFAPWLDFMINYMKERETRHPKKSGSGRPHLSGVTDAAKAQRQKWMMRRARLWNRMLDNPDRPTDILMWEALEIAELEHKIDSQAPYRMVQTKLRLSKPTPAIMVKLVVQARAVVSLTTMARSRAPSALTPETIN